MKPLVYAIGDIHGDLATFLELLAEYAPTDHQLVLIGDLLDRGPRSKDCLYLGKRLVEESGAIYLRGNHEDLLLNFVAQPGERYENYLLNGGGETLKSLLHEGAVAEYSAVEIASLLKSYHGELLAFLASLPYYYEWEQYLFVHAGVDLSLADWRQTSARDFMWIRQEFHEGRNTTGKVIVFGHTITPSLYGDNETTALWQQDGKIGIDGGGIYGGSNHGVIFNAQGILQDLELPQKAALWG